MKLQKKQLWIAGCVLAGLLVAAVITILCVNKFTLTLSVEEQKIIVEYGVKKVPEIPAVWKGTLLHKKGTPVKTQIKGKVDLTKLGEYPVTLTAEYCGKKLSEERILVVTDVDAPEITLVSSPDYYTNPASPYVEEGFTATDNYDGDVTDKVVSEEKNGEVIYTVSDSSGNKTTVKRKINYRDEQAPVINLTGGTSISLNKGKDFVDPGFTAIDECDGDLTKSVKVTGSVDGHTYGTYTLTYRVADSKGNQAEVVRTVRIADISAPVLNLNGETRLFIKVGTAYTEPGYSANDNMDGEMTAKVVVSGSVNTAKMGINQISYTVRDAFGNVTTKTRTVYVYDKQATATPINPGNKVVYLTFDDGPSKHTARLLDILDKYGVKATFFVTDQFSAYRNMIGETFRRGHTIALHTYKHQYNVLYRSEEAYYTDLFAIRDIVVQQTGVEPKIVRFPGGTSNTVSRNYCKGIMSSLVNSISYFGYQYCDWNVSSGDAGGAKTASAVYNNVISGIQRNSVSVVLQHDITSHSVEAVDDIIFWGLMNGYTFLPMSETTPMVHFRPQN